jgi:deazaflavin-dependent oxidoreductase (nitroreductase family)
MADQAFIDALSTTEEVDLTVTGRRSGRESTRPVWFVVEGTSLYLIPITGTDSGWYKNVLATPGVRLRAGGREADATAAPITDGRRLDHLRDAFRARYGAANFASYYPKPDAAVEVPLGS